jgi:hypothetical protein
MQQDDLIKSPFTTEFIQFYNEALAAYREHCINQGLVPKHSQPSVFSMSLTLNLVNDDEGFATVRLCRGDLSVELRDNVYGVKPHQKISTDCPPNSRPRRRR